MSRRPTIWSSIRQTIGRGLRETGQALDRLGVKLKMLTTTIYDFYDEAVIYEDYFSSHRNIFPLPYSGKPLIAPYNTTNTNKPLLPSSSGTNVDDKDENNNNNENEIDGVSFIAPCSTLVGSVILKKNVSIWYGAVLRADSCLNSESFYKDYNKLEQERIEKLLLQQQQQQQQQQMEEQQEQERLSSTTERHQSAGDVPVTGQSTVETVNINTITTDNTYSDKSLEVRKEDDNTTGAVVPVVVDGSTSNFKEIADYYASIKDNVTKEDTATEEMIIEQNKFHHQRVLQTIQDKVELWELDFNRYDELRTDKNAKINRTKKFLYGGAIYINDNTNVQDNVVITSAVDHCIIGTNVTIGHNAQIHSSIIGNNCLIGIGSIIQSRCYIGNNVYVGAGTIVPSGTTLEDNTMYIGNPARKVRIISEEVKEKITYQSNEYITLGQLHRTERIQNGLGDYNNPITVDAYIDNRTKIDTYNDLLYNKTEQYLTSINAVYEYNDIQKWLGNDPIEIIDDISPNINNNNKRKQEKIKYPYLQQQEEEEIDKEQLEQQQQQNEQEQQITFTNEKNKISDDRIGPNIYEQQQSVQIIKSATSQQKKRTTTTGSTIGDGTTGSTTTMGTTTKQKLSQEQQQQQEEERHTRQHIIKKGKKKVIIKIPS